MSVGVIEPSQARSRRTQERILRAVETMLRSRDFEQIHVHDIAERSGVSVGAFYGRFKSKEAMIPTLYRRYDQRLGALADRKLDGAWQELPLPALIDRLVEMTLEHYERERGLLRLIAMPGNLRPKGGRMQPNSRRLLERVYEAIRRHVDARAHDDPRAAAAFSFYAMYSTARDWILYPKAPQIAPLPRDGQLIRRFLAHQMLVFLTVPIGVEGPDV